jgi:mono/diheme cytochrome c family protein
MRRASLLWALLFLMALTGCARRQPPPAHMGVNYQVTLGRELARRYCAQCHNPASTPDRVSNYDNLDTPPLPLRHFSKTEQELRQILSDGGPTPEMPPYGATLTKPEIEALLACLKSSCE